MDSFYDKITIKVIRDSNNIITGCDFTALNFDIANEKQVSRLIEYIMANHLASYQNNKNFHKQKEERMVKEKRMDY